MILNDSEERINDAGNDSEESGTDIGEGDGRAGDDDEVDVYDPVRSHPLLQSPPAPTVTYQTPPRSQSHSSSTSTPIYTTSNEPQQPQSSRPSSRPSSPTSSFTFGNGVLRSNSKKTLVSSSSSLSSSSSSSSSSLNTSIRLPDDNGRERFEKLVKIGKGSYGRVWKALDKKTGKLVAIKAIDLETEDEMEDLRAEIIMMSQCLNPNITQYITSYTEGTNLCIVMEYLSGGSVLDLLRQGPIPEESIAIILREVLYALDYLHGAKKLHRDIKAGNVLLSLEGEIKMADFGVTAQLTRSVDKRNTFVGTPFWMAPEVIKQSDYNEKADIWSLGVTAIEMAHGEPPHAKLPPLKALFLIPKIEPPVLHESFSPSFQEFVSLCCQKDPAQRKSSKELLKHRFIKGAKKCSALKPLIQQRMQARLKERPKKQKINQDTNGDVNMDDDSDDGANEDGIPTVKGVRGKKGGIDAMRDGGNEVSISRETQASGYSSVEDSGDILPSTSSKKPQPYPAPTFVFPTYLEDKTPERDKQTKATLIRDRIQAAGQDHDLKDLEAQNIQQQPPQLLPSKRPSQFASELNSLAINQNVVHNNHSDSDSTPTTSDPDGHFFRGGSSSSENTLTKHQQPSGSSSGMGEYGINHPLSSSSEFDQMNHNNSLDQSADNINDIDDTKSNGSETDIGDHNLEGDESEAEKSGVEDTPGGFANYQPGGFASFATPTESSTSNRTRTKDKFKGRSPPQSQGLKRTPPSTTRGDPSVYSKQPTLLNEYIDETEELLEPSSPAGREPQGLDGQGGGRNDFRTLPSVLSSHQPQTPANGFIGFSNMGNSGVRTFGSSGEEQASDREAFSTQSPPTPRKFSSSSPSSSPPSSSPLLSTSSTSASMSSSPLRKTPPTVKKEPALRIHHEEEKLLESAKVVAEPLRAFQGGVIEEEEGELQEQDLQELDPNTTTTTMPVLHAMPPLTGASPLRPAPLNTNNSEDVNSDHPKHKRSSSDHAPTQQPSPTHFRSSSLHLPSLPIQPDPANTSLQQSHQNSPVKPLTPVARTSRTSNLLSQTQTQTQTQTQALVSDKRRLERLSVNLSNPLYPIKKSPSQPSLSIATSMAVNLSDNASNYSPSSVSSFSSSVLHPPSHPLPLPPLPISHPSMTSSLYLNTRGASRRRSSAPDISSPVERKAIVFPSSELSRTRPIPPLASTSDTSAHFPINPRPSSQGVFSIYNPYLNQTNNSSNLNKEQTLFIISTLCNQFENDIRSNKDYSDTDSDRMGTVGVLVERLRTIFSHMEESFPGSFPLFVRSLRNSTLLSSSPRPLAPASLLPLQPSRSNSMDDLQQSSRVHMSPTPPSAATASRPSVRLPQTFPSSPSNKSGHQRHKSHHFPSTSSFSSSSSSSSSSNGLPTNKMLARTNRSVSLFQGKAGPGPLNLLGSVATPERSGPSVSHHIYSPSTRLSSINKPPGSPNLPPPPAYTSHLPSIQPVQPMQPSPSSALPYNMRRHKSQILSSPPPVRFGYSSSPSFVSSSSSHSPPSPAKLPSAHLVYATPPSSSSKPPTKSRHGGDVLPPSYPLSMDQSYDSSLVPEMKIRSPSHRHRSQFLQTLPPITNNERSGNYSPNHRGGGSGGGATSSPLDGLTVHFSSSSPSFPTSEGGSKFNKSKSTRDPRSASPPLPPPSPPPKNKRSSRNRAASPPPGTITRYHRGSGDPPLVQPLSQGEGGVVGDWDNLRFQQQHHQQPKDDYDLPTFAPVHGSGAGPLPRSGHHGRNKSVIVTSSQAGSALSPAGTRYHFNYR